MKAANVDKVHAVLGGFHLTDRDLDVLERAPQDLHPGAFVAALRLVTGLQPLVAGKPDPALHRESVERVAAQRPLVTGRRGAS